MEVVIALVIVAVVAAWVTMPFRSAEGSSEAGLEDPVLADLEARKQAKYREIRDSELDHAQGKIGAEQFARQDAELRREAIEILKAIDAAGGDASAAPEPTPRPDAD